MRRIDEAQAQELMPHMNRTVEDGVITAQYLRDGVYRLKAYVKGFDPRTGA